MWTGGCGKDCSRLSYNVPGEEINTSYPLLSTAAAAATAVLYAPTATAALMVNYKYAIKPCRVVLGAISLALAHAPYRHTI